MTATEFILNVAAGTALLVLLAWWVSRLVEWCGNWRGRRKAARALDWFFEQEETR